MEALLTLDQVAERLAVRVVTVRRLISAGQLAACRPTGHRNGVLRVRVSDVIALIERRMQEARRDSAPCPPHSTGLLGDDVVVRSTECPRCGRLIPPADVAAPPPARDVAVAGTEIAS